MTDYSVPKKTFDQLTARRERVPSATIPDSGEIKYLLYVLLVINLAILGFLIGMFISYLVF